MVYEWGFLGIRWKIAWHSGRIRSDSGLFYFDIYGVMLVRVSPSTVVVVAN